MSIEQALAENIAAINNLAAILNAHAEALAAKVDKPVVKTGPKIATKADKTTQADVTYDDVKARVLALSKDFGRDITVDVLSRCGASKAPDLNEDQYADFIAKADAVLNGEEV